MMEKRLEWSYLRIRDGVWKVAESGCAQTVKTWSLIWFKTWIIMRCDLIIIYIAFQLKTTDRNFIRDELCTGNVMYRQAAGASIVFLLLIENITVEIPHKTQYLCIAKTFSKTKFIFSNRQPIPAYLTVIFVPIKIQALKRWKFQFWLRLVTCVYLILIGTWIQLSAERYNS